MCGVALAQVSGERRINVLRVGDGALDQFGLHDGGHGC